MRLIPLALAAVLVIAWNPAALAQNAAPAQPPQKNPSDSISKKDADPELALQKALADAGNDRAAVVRNLKAYLQKFPDSPRKAAVYRAIVESCEQLQDNACSLEYAERFVALHPDDSVMMMLEGRILQEQGDASSLERGRGYVSRGLDRVENRSVAENKARVSTEAWQQHHDQLVAALSS